MAQISVTPEELRQQATTYSNGNQTIQELEHTIESMNSTIAEEWKGAAFEAFLNLWNESLKPSLNTVAQNLQETHDRLVQQANASEEFDNQSQGRFQ